MDLYLRKVKGAHHAYRVITIIDGEEFQLGSIGVKTFTSMDSTWTWGIDTVVPMRDFESEGRGDDRKDCMLKFKAAWQRFAADPARLIEFLDMKRRARRT